MFFLLINYIQIPSLNVNSVWLQTQNMGTNFEMVPITLYPQCRKYNEKKQTAEIKEAKDSLILILFSQHLRKSHFYIRFFS